MPLSADERRIIQSYQGNVSRVRRAVERYLRTVWSGMESYRDADIARMVARVVPVVLGGQRQTAALTSTYLAAVASMVLGVPARPAPVGSVTDLRGVPSTDVYRRPGVTVWTALSAGKPLREAVREGGGRLLSLAATDLQLAKTHTARDVMARDARVVGYQRVVSGNACQLCTFASTQRYHVEDLLPIHPGCGCDVAPIYGDRDPGQVIDPETLDRLHEAAGEIPGFEVHEHGEYGPTLTVAGQDFTGPADI